MTKHTTKKGGQESYQKEAKTPKFKAFTREICGWRSECL